MAGYTRQSVADIIANAVIKAAPVNAEFNAIRDGFAFSGGHKHDGSSAEGAYVPLIADVDANNKVVVDTVNNRIGFYSEVGGVPVEQLRIQDGVVVPVTDNDIDLGAVGAEFKDLHIDGVGYIDTIQIHENATIAGTLDVTGTTTGTSIVATTGFTGGLTGDVTGNVTGNLTGNVTGNVTGNINSSGTSVFANADINGGTVDGTIIGATTPSAGTFTTATTTGQATLNSADINGGTIDGTVIGGASAQAVTGTVVTANTGFIGPLSGAVTGNVTGNLTGNVTGNLTGNVTGNVTAASGTSSFSDVTINGTLNMNAGTAATITNLSTPVNAGDAATKSYVDTSVANVIDAAPAALDTLNELAAALGDDANFSTTITNSIATKLPLAGGTMSGAIAMATNKITGLGTPTANQDAATKGYVDTQDATKLNLSGGTMTGTLTMGSNKITSTATPTADSDLTRKAYVDSILGSATSAATSAAAAAVSETNAATSETNASNSAAAAAESYDNFDDRYLGAKASAPTLDNDGDALLTGALYWDTTTSNLFIWTGSAWSPAVFDTAGAMFSVNNLSDVADVVASRTNLGLGTMATQADSSIDINGGTIDGTVIGGTTPAAGNFTTGSFTGNATFGDNDKAIFGAGSDLQIFHSGTASWIRDLGTGGLVIDTDGTTIDIKGSSPTEYMARFIKDGAVSLYYDNSAKLATDSTGINVTGAVTATAFVGDGSALTGISGGIAYIRKTSAYTTVANEGVIADTSAGSWTLTLPATPLAGDTVMVVDGADWSINNLTVARNGSTIEGDAEDMVMNIGGAAVQFTYDGTTWQTYVQVGALAGLGTTRVNFVATEGQTVFIVTYSAGFVDVYLNGIKLIAGTDFTATNGTTIVLTAGATGGDTVDVVAYDTFSVADTYSVAGADATFVNVTGDTVTGDLVVTGSVTAGSFVGVKEPFAPVAVTGTTPSLDVGTYNYFDNGTLTGDTTVSFASVPTEARWTYSFIADFLTTYDLEVASYDSKSFDLNPQSTFPRGLFFKPDGTKMYVLLSLAGTIYQYTLSTAWDVSTASYDSVSFSVSGQDTSPYGIFFKPDGTKMYLVGNTGDDINQYTLSTAWDLSTASFDSVVFSVNAQDSFPVAVHFKDDGTKMYVLGIVNDSVYQYTLSTAWDVSTASYDTVSFSVTTEESIPYGVFFKDDGTKMYITGDASASVFQYSLSTAWDLSTASYDSVSFSVASQDTDPHKVFFKPDGTKMYVTGATNHFVYQYNTSTGAALTLPAAVQNPPTEVFATTDGATVTYEFATLDGGTTVRLIKEEVL